MNVEDFCTREVVIIERDSTVLEAAKFMRSHHVGDVVVVDAHGNINVPISILTDQDIDVEPLAE